MNRTILVVWLFTLILAIGMPAVSYSSLPDRMASHFDFSGKADGYSSKDGFYLLWYLQTGIMNLMIFGVSWLVRKAPASMINVPNKTYWMATPERRRQCAEKTMGLVAVIISCVNLFLVGLFQSVIDVNHGVEPSLPFWLPLLLLPLSGIVAVVYILKAFKVPQEHSAGNPAIR
jgi:uncharacterized membrane protein